MPLNPTNLLEEYKNLRTELVSTMGTISNIFNYGLVTLGLSFTAIQFIFNQINEFTKSSSTSNRQIEFLFILLWILLVGFVPFVCIIFIFKGSSVLRVISFTN